MKDQTVSMLKHLGERPTYGALRRGVYITDTEVFTNIKKPSGGAAFAIKNAYRYEGEKFDARWRIINLICASMQHGQPLSVLSMPGISWAFEKKILARMEGNWGFTESPARTFFTCIENDKLIYYAAIASARMPGRCTPHALIQIHQPPSFAETAISTRFIKRFFLANVDDLMLESDDAWDVVWLDYTGPLSGERMEIIKTFFATRVRSLLAITALKARWERPLAKTIASKGYREWLTACLGGSIVDYHEYATDSPMAQIVVAP